MEVVLIYAVRWRVRVVRELELEIFTLFIPQEGLEAALNVTQIELVLTAILNKTYPSCLSCLYSDDLML